MMSEILRSGKQATRKQRGKKATENAYMQGFSDGVNFMYMLEHPEEFTEQLEAMKRMSTEMLFIMQGKK